MTPRKIQIPFQYYCVNPFLIITDFLIKGIITKTVTIDKDMGLETKTPFCNFLP